MKKLLLTACLLALTGPASAETLALKNTVVDFKPPPHWEMDQQGSQRMALRSPDGRFLVTLWLLEESSAALNGRVMQNMRNELKSILTEFQANQELAAPARFTSYSASFMSGSGKRQGQTVNWEISLIEMQRPLMIVALWRPDGAKGNEKAFNQMLMSLKG